MQINQNELSRLTDEELLQLHKKMRSTSIINAVLIGFLVGIILYSIMNNSLGFLTLIPLFFAFKLNNNSKQSSKQLQDLLKDRNLK